MNFVLKKITAIVLCFGFILSVASISYYSDNSAKFSYKDYAKTKQTLKNTDDSKGNTLEESQDEAFVHLGGSFLLSLDIVSQKYDLELIPPLGFLSSPPFSPPNA